MALPRSTRSMYEFDCRHERRRMSALSSHPERQDHQQWSPPVGLGSRTRGLVCRRLSQVGLLPIAKLKASETETVHHWKTLWFFLRNLDGFQTRQSEKPMTRPRTILVSKVMCCRCSFNTPRHAHAPVRDVCIKHIQRVDLFYCHLVTSPDVCGSGQLILTDQVGIAPLSDCHRSTISRRNRKSMSQTTTRIELFRSGSRSNFKIDLISMIGSLFCMNP